MSIGPLVPNLPATTGAYENKYGPGTAYTPALISQFPGATPLTTLAPLQRYDLARVLRGQMPLTSTQSALALRALATNAPATQPRNQGFLHSALSDLRALVGGIPKLPFALYNEAKALPSLATQLPATLANSDSPLQAIGNVASLPGFRFIPGSFVANQMLGSGQYGSQGLAGLQAHPLFTALDVLPAAEGVAKLSPAYKTALANLDAANEARVAERAALNFDPSTTRLLREPQALRTALTRRVASSAELADELGLTPSRLGQITQGTSDLFRSTAPGRAIAGTFLDREVPRIFSANETAARAAANPATPTELIRLQGYAADDIARAMGVRDLSRDLVQAHTDLNLTPQRAAEFYDAATNPRLPDGTPTTPEMLPGWSEEERAVMRQLRDFQTVHGDYLSNPEAALNLPATQRLRKVEIDGRPEYFDYATGTRVSRAQQSLASAREFADIREMILDPSKVDITSLDARLADVVGRESEGLITKAQSNELSRAIIQAGEEAGWGLDPRTGEWERIIDTPRPTPANVIDALKPYRNQPVVARAIDHLQKGRWSEANRELASLSRRQMHLLPIDLDGFKAEMSRLIARDRTLARTAHITPQYLDRLQSYVNKVEARSIPARFTEGAADIARETTKAKLRETFITDPNLDRYIADIDAGIYDNLPDGWGDIVRKDQAAARQTWKALRDAGYDPIFVSRVSPAQARAQEFVRLAPQPTTIGSVKARMMDATPVAKDIGIAVNQQQLDIIQRLATNSALDEIGRAGVKRADLAEALRPLAEQRFARNPDIPLAAHLDRLISDRWVKWEPGQFNGVTRGIFAPERAADIYIPRVWSEQIGKMFEPPLPRLSALTDPLMRVFRTSVLPLALRWHLNNIVSGAIIMGINDPRAYLELPHVWQQLRRERAAVRGELDNFAEADRITKAGSPPSTIGGQPQEIRAWDARVSADSPVRDRLAAAYNYALGRSMRDWMDQAREGRVSKIRDAARRGIEASYDANQFIDDVVRASIGESYEKALLKQGGRSQGLIDAMVSTRIRRVFQAWDEMTPMERSVIRSVIPFYGFASFATRYALRYPFDHPFRASILNSVARAELQDSISGLPEYLRDMIFMGDPRTNGVTKAVNIQPFNPFGGVPSMFTLQGLLGQLAPQYSAALESLGMDVQAGAPSLYPETHYDPETGRLVAGGNGGFLSNLTSQALPQLGGITALLGRNADFKDTLARDPAAAGRMLMSSFGIPILFRSVDTGQEQIKSEMARYQDQENARREALRTGNYGKLSAFPGLAGYQQQIAALSGQTLNSLRPGQLPAAYTSALPPSLSTVYAAQVAALGRAS